MNAAEYFDHWNIVWRDLLRAVSLLRDDHLVFRPAVNYDRTVGEILDHIADLEAGWIHYVICRQLPDWPQPDLTRPVTVEAHKIRLNQIHRETLAYLPTIPLADFERIIQIPGDGTAKLGRILWHVLEQQIHHRGELFLSLSLLGIDRPEIDHPS